VDEDLLVQTRSDEVENGIEASGKQVEYDRFVNNEGGQGLLLLPNCAAAAEMKDMLTYRLGSEASAGPYRLGPKIYTQTVVGDFCNGSIRRRLNLRKRLAMSTTIRHTVKRLLRLRVNDPHINHYAFVDGWLTGARGYFDRTEADNDLLNLYDAANQGVVSTSHSLMAGIFLLHLLAKRQYCEGGPVACLTRVGFNESIASSTLEAFHAKRLFKYGNLDSQGRRQIEPQMRVIQAYQELLPSTPYTDNMAIVTPVEDRFRTEMKRTVSYDFKQFVARVETALAFLGQVREDEATVCLWKERAHGTLTDWSHFQKEFDALEFPSVYRQAAYAYRQRLTALRKNPLGLEDVVKATDWDKLLADDIIDVAADKKDEPLKARSE
jgi:hypothetical protein